ncbi:hypothetical protein UFOVP558_64 [uncultured Caudovirales phage]|uniref:Uncharacterized protein n=1 Tax=uncultured Caudovirales phage TaxID=2100421 RepID=A0A6J5MUI1_9CAUD|nr:hypothetical protein UFOVP558_64 [uncultured Caudovirales phage]
MRNGKGDHFSKLLRRRITQLKRIAGAAKKENRPIESLVARQIADELEMQLIAYDEFRAKKP